MYIFKALIICVFLSACHKESRNGDQINISGQTMGTTWSLAFRDSPASGTEIRESIQNILNYQEAIYSLWNQNSVLSQLNRTPAGESFPVPVGLVELVSVAARISKHSGGAYDITVSPLLKIWGYGAGAISEPMSGPRIEDIESSLEMVGMDKIHWSREPPAVTRLHQGVELDFNSLAKGNCLDLVAARLKILGVKHFVFELGGEVLARGHQIGETGGWPVGIQSPDGRTGHLAGSIRLINSVLATSGTYYQQGHAGSVPTTHIIDPVKGCPVSHSTVSVSVIGDNGAHADAWATALLVLGEDKGRALAEMHGIRAIFISK